MSTHAADDVDQVDVEGVLEAIPDRHHAADLELASQLRSRPEPFGEVTVTTRDGRRYSGKVDRCSDSLLVLRQPPAVAGDSGSYTWIRIADVTALEASTP